MIKMPVNILGIESSCDDTAAAIIRGGVLLSNVIANQDVHKKYGGVVPELASRAHQQNIIPVVDRALQEAGVSIQDVSGVAFTQGPGLLGSLLVGASFAKGFALARKIPLLGVNHLHAHILAHFIQLTPDEKPVPRFPFLCLLVSGGHTLLVLVKGTLEMEIIGETIDDAAGEAFDKCAKVMGLPYPGGPMIDMYGVNGDPEAFRFTKPAIPALNYSFSGLKTAFLYFLRDRLKEDPRFIEKRRDDLCASIQKTIVGILTEKLVAASRQTGIREIALAGGVSANSALRGKIIALSASQSWNVYIPEMALSTDNAAMIAMAGYFQYMGGQYSGQHIAPAARLRF